MLVTCDKPAPYPLKDIEIIFQKTDPATERYRVLDGRGRLLTEGTIPPSRRVRVSIP